MRCKLLPIFMLLFLPGKVNAQVTAKDILHDKIPVPYTGKLIDAYQFNDKVGQHIYLVTKFEEDKPVHKVSIFGFGYTRVNGSFVKDWEIRDFSDDDVLLHYPFTRIADIDKDGVYETIFVYTLDPNSGLGANWKVMLHYKNKKYVLRVHIPELDNDEYTEVYDKSFDTIPPSIKKYVVALWNAVAKENELRGTEWYRIHAN